MFRTTVTRKNGNKHQAEFKTQQESQAWLAQEIDNKSFGPNERWVSGLILSDEEKASALESRSNIDLGGVEIVEYKLAAEYTIIEEDISAEIAAKEADEDDRKQVGQFLKHLKKADIKTVDDCAQVIMKIVKHLRADK